MIILKPTLTTKNLLIWVLLILIAILLLKQCTKKIPSASVASETEKKEIIEKAQKVLEKTMDSLTKIIVKREDRADSILGESTVFEYERNQAWAVIKDRDNMIESIASKVLDEDGRDSLRCIELAKQSQLQSGKIREQEDLTVKLLDDLHLLSQTKDSIIGDERRIKDAALKQGLQTATAYSQLFEKFKKTQPRTQVFIGSDGYFNPEEMGVGGSIGFLNKNGTFYMAKTGITTNAQYYIGGSIMFRISFRKK